MNTILIKRVSPAFDSPLSRLLIVVGPLSGILTPTMAAQNSASRLRKDGSQKSDASSMISLRDDPAVRNNGISRTVSAGMCPQ